MFFIKKKHHHKRKKYISDRINIELDGEIISKRNLSLNDSIYCIREKMNKNLLNSSFIDEDDNAIDLEDEKDYQIKDLIQEKTIKLKSNKKIQESIDLENKLYENLNNSHELLKKKGYLKIYKYSNKKVHLCHDLIYQYFYDEFNEEDYKNAKIILFIGKTGDGKTTAINAIFNIIKGIKIKDGYRFILIKEQEKVKKQAESQTDGLHLYYIKDFNNNPIIIIDSQGFGDTRGREFDKKINKAFEYIFSSNIIDHINTICFIAKSTDARLDITLKYIFSSVTSLFSDDICQNFIFLTTHSSIITIKEDKPAFINTISNYKIFWEMNIRMNQKWWYTIDSISLFESEIDNLVKYSFNQLNELYEEKIKNSIPKDISKSYEITKYRNQLKSKIMNIISIFKSIISKKEKISENNKIINEFQAKINNKEFNIGLKDELLNVTHKSYERNNINNERNNLYNEKRNLENNKNYYINNNQRIYNEINVLNNNLKSEIINLINNSQKIDNIAMNKQYIEIENKYIISSIQYINDIGHDDDNQLNKLKEDKKCNEVYLGLKNISEKQLNNYGIEYFFEQIKNLIK